jgi:hypothetical protein
MRFDPALWLGGATANRAAIEDKGRNPRRRPLLDRTKALGFWIRVATDSVRSLDQQYQP